MTILSKFVLIEKEEFLILFPVFDFSHQTLSKVIVFLPFNSSPCPHNDRFTLRARVNIQNFLRGGQL